MYKIEAANGGATHGLKMSADKKPSMNVDSKFFEINLLDKLLNIFVIADGSRI